MEEKGSLAVMHCAPLLLTTIIEEAQSPVLGGLRLFD